MENWKTSQIGRARVLVPLLVGLRVPGPLFGHQLGHSLGLVLLTAAHALSELGVDQLGGLDGLKSEGAVRAQPWPRHRNTT